eukprot:CAMPEP_0203866936 /NCGR_PEP_ID=MMETSP0359-20131031/16233_1 /ASSEMBLY_ACC=CAM_ASM_000338 /TAXON_ID=268821 /ORGANISM="Scrippsiella Hangoei, Strain SHTV-5" /LENGTH=76 /DNA_ID=CAMNT_0050785101 /DNA_START=425 /DNA_END=652 /DNA_ORIENTATION=+
MKSSGAQLSQSLIEDEHFARDFDVVDVQQHRAPRFSGSPPRPFVVRQTCRGHRPHGPAGAATTAAATAPPKRAWGA